MSLERELDLGEFLHAEPVLFGAVDEYRCAPRRLDKTEAIMSMSMLAWQCPAPAAACQDRTGALVKRLANNQSASGR